jgi:cytochrome c biogenesis protein CcmG, thiol:disulfide interchange protein DsbE
MQLLTLLFISILSVNALAHTLTDGPDLDVEQPAPLFSLKHLSGEGEIALADFKGKVVYLDFWASWCVPCRRSFPFLVTLRERYAKQGLEVIGVNLDENPQQAQQFLQEYPVTYPIVTGFATPTPLDYKVNAMPSAFLIDGQGKLRLIHLVFTEQHQVYLEAIIEKLLAEL